MKKIISLSLLLSMGLQAGGPEEVSRQDDMQNQGHDQDSREQNEREAAEYKMMQELHERNGKQYGSRSSGLLPTVSETQRVVSQVSPAHEGTDLPRAGQGAGSSRDFERRAESDFVMEDVDQAPVVKDREYWRIKNVILQEHKEMLPVVLARLGVRANSAEGRALSRDFFKFVQEIEFGNGEKPVTIGKKVFSTDEIKSIQHNFYIRHDYPVDVPVLFTEHYDAIMGKE